MIDMNAELAKQLRFLSAACAQYDAGDAEAATLIAIRLRVLCFDKKGSPSLLRHLDATDIRIVTSFLSGIDTEMYAFGSALSNATLTINALGENTCKMTMAPVGEDAIKSGHTLPFMEWWNQPIYRFDPQNCYSRNDLIRIAADKDGGAHVDGKLPAFYAALGMGYFSGQIELLPLAPDGNQEVEVTVHVRMGGGTNEVPGFTAAKYAHYADIRQMATEILMSEELLKFL